MIRKGKRLGYTFSEIRELISSRAKASPPEAVELDSFNLAVSLGREHVAAQIAHLERQRAGIEGTIKKLRLAYERMPGRVG